MSKADELRKEADRISMLAEAQANREKADELIAQAKTQEAQVQKEFIEGVAKAAGKMAVTGVVAATTGVVIS